MKLTLPGMWETFVRDSIASGRYADESEVLKEALRLLEKRDSQLEDLQRAIREGEESGEPIPADEVFAKLRARISEREKA